MRSEDKSQIVQRATNVLQSERTSKENKNKIECKCSLLTDRELGVLHHFVPRYRAWMAPDSLRLDTHNDNDNDNDEVVRDMLFIARPPSIHLFHPLAIDCFAVLFLLVRLVCACSN